MTFDYSRNIYHTSFGANFDPNAPLAKPIETVQKTIEGTVDTFIPQKDSKRRNSAIAVASSVLVLSGLVAILNPKFSPKVISKLKSFSKVAQTKAENNKIYKFGEKAANFSVRGVQFINNFNTGKDGIFKWFCTEKKEFYNVRNKTTKRVLKRIDRTLLKLLKKPHEVITKLFDNISKSTVLSKYKSTGKKLNSLEDLIMSYKDKLPDKQKAELEAKLSQIRETRKYFNQEETKQRFDHQEELMSELEHTFWSRMRQYKRGFRNKWQKKSDHIDKNLNFWAEEIMKPQKAKVEAAGEEVVHKLVGDGNGKKGAYSEAIDILSPYISAEEKALIETKAKKAAKKLKKANKSECSDYFDKKRDLVMGSAPTDVVSAIAGLGMSGIALTIADNKEDRVSKLLTGVFPIIGGLGTSMLFTARLVSGPVGMIAGAGTGLLLNIIGSMTNKYVLGNNSPEDEKETQNA